MQPDDITTTSKTEPWDEAKPFYEDLYAAANAAFLATNKVPYTGEYYAGQNAFDDDVASAIADAADLAVTDAGYIRTYAGELKGGTYVSHTTNPYLPAAVTAALNEVQERLTDILIPQVIDQAIQAGAYGGPRQDLLETAVLNDFSRQATDATGRIYYENYARERQIMNTFPAVYQAAEGARQLEVQQRMARADLARSFEQTELDEAFKHYTDDLQSNFTGMGEWASILNGGGFRTTTQTTPSTANPLASGLQGMMSGGLLGAQAATQFGGVAAGSSLSAFMPFVAPLAILGGLAGGFS